MRGDSVTYLKRAVARLENENAGLRRALPQTVEPDPVKRWIFSLPSGGYAELNLAGATEGDVAIVREWLRLTMENLHRVFPGSGAL